MLSSEQLARTASPPNQSSCDVVGKFGQWSVIAIGGLKCTSKEGTRLSLNRMRQGRSAKRNHEGGNGRISGNPRTQTRDRGNARQIMERYLALAQEASSAGDRIAAEGHFQHAEHYFRVMTADGRDTGEQEHHTQPQRTSFEGQPHPDLG